MVVRCADKLVTSLALLLFVHIAVLTAPAQQSSPARGQNSCPHEITECGCTIDEGGQFGLANDLEDCSVGLYITASHVELLLNDHKIIGNGQGTAIRVGGEDGQCSHNTDVTIALGKIQNFDVGILLNGVEKSRVSTIGVQDTDFAFETDACDGVPSRENTFLTNGAFDGRVGFLVIQSENSVFRENVARRNSETGFAILQSQNNTFEINFAEDNKGIGIQAGRGAVGNTIRHNTATGNSNYDLSDQPNCPNTWRDNTFGKANESCIH